MSKDIFSLALRGIPVLILTHLSVIQLTMDCPWLIYKDKQRHFLSYLVFYQTSLCNHDLCVVHSCRHVT